MSVQDQSSRRSSQPPNNGLLRSAPWISGALLVGFVSWLLLSSDSRTAMERAQQFVGMHSPEDGLSPAIASPERVAWLALGVLGAALLAVGAMVLRPYLRRPDGRSLRSWFLTSFLACAWLAAVAGWREIYWCGQSWRVTAEVASAERIASALRQRWPAYDGDDPELGFVLGYPKDAPTTLLLAGEPLAMGSLRIAAVEKSDAAGLLRFQLASPNGDTWLVYSPRGAPEGEVVNGLDTRRVATRTQRLSRRWFLVRYVAA